MNKHVLAADLGGTNLRMAVVDDTGTVIHRCRTKTPASGDYAEVVSRIAETAKQCLDAVEATASPTRLSLAIPSSVRPYDGMIVYSPAIPQLNGSRLADDVSQALRMPVTLENDANAAAVGENWLGASKDVRTSICITLGTGVGGGIILNGELYRGVDGTAAEIGHICIEPEGRKCGCGSRGCLEQYASATAIARMAEELLPEFPNSILHGDVSINAHSIYNAGKGGDDLALKTFRRMGYYLGIGLSGLVNLLNPEVIVIGGGASAGWDLFADEMRSELDKRAFQQPAERVKLLRAVLGDDAGILGAARLALNSTAVGTA